MTPEQFRARCRQVWHVAPPGAWRLISQHGFRTAAQLIDAAELDDADRRRLGEQRRRESVRLVVDGNEVVLRDQGPLFARRDLTEILPTGWTEADWVRLLNRRVYFFTSRKPMGKMLHKYVEADGAQELLTISPLRLLVAARRRLELTEQNAGAVQRRAGRQKGPESFVPLNRFPNRTPAEITVIDGVNDPTLVARAVLIRAGGNEEILHPRA